MAEIKGLKIVIEAVDRITAPIRRINQSLAGMRGRVSAASAGMSRAFSRVGGAVNRFGDASFSAFKTMSKGVAGAAAVVAGSAFAFDRLFIGTAAKFEQFRVQLEALEGSSAKAKRAMAFVNDFVQKTPASVDQAMEAYVRLRAFGLDPMDGTLQAVMDQTAKLGFSQENLMGISLALGQAWTKQKLQGDDILQLVTRGVPVYDLLAKATGRNKAQLEKLASQGKLGRKAIRLLIEEMGRSAKGAAEANMKTWNGMVSNLTDQWTRFVNMVMEAGAFDAIKARLASVLDAVNRMAKSGELQRFAKEFSDTVVKTVDVIWALGKATVGVFRGIKAVIDVVAPPIKALFNAISALSDKVLTLFDSTFGTRIKEAIGRNVALFLAGLGNENANAAVFTEARARGVQKARQELSRPPLTAQPTAQSPVSTQVGGRVKIVIEGGGRARVVDAQSDNPDVPLDVDTGPVMVAP